MAREKRIDIFSLIIGILASLVAQGVWAAVYKWATGEYLGSYLDITLVLIALAIILNILVLYYYRNLLTPKNVEKENYEKEKIELIKAILKQQEETNKYLAELTKDKKDNKPKS